MKRKRIANECIGAAAVFVWLAVLNEWQGPLTSGSYVVMASGFAALAALFAVIAEIKDRGNGRR